MKKFSSVVFTFFFLVAGLFAQQTETLFGEAGLRLSGAWAGPTFGAAMFSNETVPIRGSFVGLEFNRVLFVGIGRERTTHSVEIGGVENGSFKLRQRGLLIGFSPLSQKVVHPKISFLMAGGEVKVGEREDDIFVVQPGAGLEVNIFQWWKLGFEGGYRFVSRADLAGLENEDLSAFFLNLSLRFGFSWGE